MNTYIDANPEAGKRFYQNFHNKGKIVMLNLLKFNSKANYKNFKDLQPEMEIAGEEAYKIYMKNVLPRLEKVGSRIIYFGCGSDFIIGPESEKWDAVLLVEHESVLKFMEFSQDEIYLKNAGHRTAALADSRLFPSIELKTHFSE